MLKNAFCKIIFKINLDMKYILYYIYIIIMYLNHFITI
jgi:hypothetical protein